MLRFAVLTLLGGLVACASAHQSQTYGEGDGSIVHFDAAKDPYWQDPRWAKNLFDAVQSVVHDPVDASDTSTPNLNAVVKFTYAEGNIQYPEVIRSTGDAAMDQLLIRQVASAQVPLASGLDADEPHEFVLELTMPTPFESFEGSVAAAIDRWKVYPKEAVLGAYQGMVLVGFDYLDGKASDIAVAASSKNGYLDNASRKAVATATLPPSPTAYAGKTLHLVMVFCYSLRQPETAKDPCPAGRNIVEVTGTIIRR